MTIPDFQSCMLPLLQFASGSEERSIGEAYSALAEYFELTEDEMNQLLPGGTQLTYKNRIAWANSYLKQAGLLEGTKRGYFKITQRGHDVLDKNPKTINISYLKQFPEFIQFRERKSSSDDRESSEETLSDESKETPEEIFQNSFQLLQKSLEAQLLTQIKSISPSQFEQLVVDLLVKMGYGGNRRNAGQAFKRSHDNGIDGVIKEDTLGLDTIYVQAKKWDKDNTVSRPEIQKFAGALQGQGATKGVFITTAYYSREASEFAKNLQQSRIILIDGKRLASLMVEYNLGVSTKETYEIKEVDFDYFTDE